MLGATRWRPDVRLVVVLTLSALVYAGSAVMPSAVAQIRQPTAKAKRAGEAPKAKPTDDALPRAVLDMQDQIETAVRSGRLEDLNDAIDWNEMKPDLGPGFVANPIAYWKSISMDGQGRDILDVIGKLLAGKPAVRSLGRDVENNRLYVWPSFADTPISKLTPAESEALETLVRPDLLGPMRQADRYSGWRLVLGADGVWHSFRRD